jgi:hypothetical protein
MPQPPRPEDWSRAYARVQAVTDRQILALLRDSLNDVNKQLRRTLGSGIGAKVRADQLLVVKRALLNEIGDIYASLGKMVPAGQLRAAAAALQTGEAFNESLFALAGHKATAQAITAGLMKGLESTIDVVIARVTGTHFPLSQRIYRSQLFTSGMLDNKINSALVRGLSAREFAKEMEDFFNPDTPGGVRFASMRLARTEINNAFHATTVSQIGDAPWIEGFHWNLSQSHPKADDCDALATQNSFGLGEGNYPPRDTPSKPHPQCLCVVTPIAVEDDEFLDSLLHGKYDSYLKRTVGGDTFESPSRSFESGVDARLLGAARGPRALNAVPAGLGRSQGVPLTRQQLAAVRDYKSSFFLAINGQLRRGEVSATVARTIGNIDSAMAVSRLETGIMSWRGVGDASKMFGSRLEADMTGLEWEELAYTSTTAAQHTALSFAENGSDSPVLMEILTPQGTGALRVGDDQSEILLERGLRFRVIADHGKSPRGYRFIIVQVV